MALLRRLCLVLPLAALPAQAQILLKADFDAPSPICFSNAITVAREGDVFPHVTATNIDTGGLRGHALSVNVNSSQSQYPWSGCDQRPDDQRRHEPGGAPAGERPQLFPPRQPLRVRLPLAQ